jgi:hypothetical protein
MQHMVSYMWSLVSQVNSTSPDVVARAVLKAVTSENPSQRYLAGKDVEGWIEGKRSMSDEEFYKMMKQNIMK